MPDGRSFLLLGDSHITTIEIAAAAGLMARPCRSVKVGGATSIGMRNPNSKTNAMAKFAAALFPFRDDIIPIFHLGEVDCGFVIWWRAAVHGESIDSQLAASIRAYVDFIDRVVAAGYRDMIVTGATLPTIRDGQDWGEVANARRDVTASLRDRTSLTLRYNATIAQSCAERNLPFVDISPALLNPRTGMVADHFRHPDPTDHHLDPALAGPLWAEALNAVDLTYR